MRKPNSGRFLSRLSIAITSIALLWAASQSVPAKQAMKHITVLYTNDTLGVLEPCG